MNALVIKTNTIVNIVEKRGDHYLDTNFNPYTKDELEFFIKQNKRHSDDVDDDEEEEKDFLGFEINGQMLPFQEFGQLQIMSSRLEKVLWLAATVIEQHPDFSPRQVADYCLEIYKILKDNLLNGQ